MEDSGGPVKSGATTLASVVEGDAPVKGDNLSALDRILRGRPLPRARPKRQRHQHNAGDDGLLATNRSGYSLCLGWQDGTCTDSRTKGWCSRVPGMAHQCAKCLSQEHGALACQRPAAQTSRGVGSWTGYDRSKRQKWRQGWQPVLTILSVPEADAVGQVPSLEREHDAGVEYLASPPSEEVPSGVNVPVCWRSAESR